MLGSHDNDVTPCVAGQRKKRFPGRWSLRHLIYSSPILNRRRGQNGSEPSKSHKKESRDVPDGKVGTSSKESERHHVQIHQATSRTSVYTTSTKSGDAASNSLECPLCFAELTAEDFCELEGCGHRACICCFQQYLRVEITESRICISCPECLEPMHPNEIRAILNNPSLLSKYEDFMVRRVLAVDPDTRWCPAPDCSFAVIASECASCPKLRCERPGCDSYFCYHCKAEWHPNQTCDAARALRSPHVRSSSVSYSQDSQHRDDIKPCPRCQVLIVKMDDGSCNHMMCAVCGAEFCWLCMKEINDLHFLSPSGCTFWGKKPWSRKKKILWQLGTLVGAPVGIALVASITIPAMVIGIPVWVGRKLYARYKTSGKHKRNTAIIGGVIASVLISPILAGLAVGIGVPILLFYVYGVVPLSLCRSGGCGGSASAGAGDDGVGGGGGAGRGGGSRAEDDSASVDAASAKGGAGGSGEGAGGAMNPSIGEASLSMASGSQVLSDHFGLHPTPRDADGEEEEDGETASTAALAGSLGQGQTPGGRRLDALHADLASAQRFSLTSLSESANASSLADDANASVRALAGSMLNYKTPGSDSCSCVTTEDCTSERVRFDDGVGGGVGFVMTASQAEKTSIGSSCSFRARCAGGGGGRSAPAHKPERGVGDALSDDSICIDIDDKTSRKYSSQAAILRSQFFHAAEDGKPATKSLDDKTVIEVSNESSDKHARPLVFFLDD